MFRGSLAALMGVVALAGLGFAALRSPTEMMASAVYSGMIAALLAGGFFAATSIDQRRRRFWRMFFACGVVHLGLISVPWPGPQPITSHLVEWAYEQSTVHPSRNRFIPVQRELFITTIADTTELLHVRANNVATYTSLMPLNLFQIGTHLVTLVVALVGGGLAALVPIAPRADGERSAEAN